MRPTDCSAVCHVVHAVDRVAIARDAVSPDLVGVVGKVVSRACNDRMLQGVSRDIHRLAISIASDLHMSSDNDLV